MTADKIKQCEETALEVIKANHPIYAKETPLPIAKEIEGLRVMNAEVGYHKPLAACVIVHLQIYPNPARVLSIGVPVDKLVEDPSGPWGTDYSVEFCCGT